MDSKPDKEFEKGGKTYVSLYDQKCTGFQSHPMYLQLKNHNPGSAKSS